MCKYAAIGIMGLTFALHSFAEYSLSFVEGTKTCEGAKNCQQLALGINTLKSTVELSGSDNNELLNSWLALEGKGELDSEFGLIVSAGFGFNPSVPAYDLSAFSDEEKNTIRFRYTGIPEGVAPFGGGTGFDSTGSGQGEILYFTIQGLEPGQLLKLTGYSLKDKNPERIDLYYGDECKKVTTSTADMDVDHLQIRLGNGDRFGFAYNQSSGTRSALRSISFDVISDKPLTLGFMY